MFPIILNMPWCQFTLKFLLFSPSNNDILQILSFSSLYAWSTTNIFIKISPCNSNILNISFWTVINYMRFWKQHSAFRLLFLAWKLICLSVSWFPSYCKEVVVYLLMYFSISAILCLDSIYRNNIIDRSRWCFKVPFSLITFNCQINPNLLVFQDDGSASVFLSHYIIEHKLDKSI